MDLELVGRVAKTGTVKVESLACVERYSHVMHIVSRVTAELDPAKGGAEVLANGSHIWHAVATSSLKLSAEDCLGSCAS